MVQRRYSIYENDTRNTNRGSRRVGRSWRDEGSRESDETRPRFASSSKKEEEEEEEVPVPLLEEPPSAVNLILFARCLQTFRGFSRPDWTRFDFHVNALRASTSARVSPPWKIVARAYRGEPISRVSFIVAVPYLRMTHCCHEYREEILPSIHPAMFRAMTLDREKNVTSIRQLIFVQSILKYGKA